MPSKRYRLRFDFDAEGEPPAAYITDEETPFCSDVIQVFENAKCTIGDFSWNPEDWEAGPLTTHLLMLLNTKPRDDFHVRQTQ